MTYLPQILFCTLLLLAGYSFYTRFRSITKVIRLGKDEHLNDQSGKRWKNVMMLALGQKKMFKYPLVAFFHLIIYVGFIIINVELLEIVLDGALGTHRLFLPFLGEWYAVLINAFEVLALGVLVVCIIFLTRRYVLSIWRFRHSDLNGWPSKDAAIILVAEIVLMGLFLFMNAADTLLQEWNYSPYTEHLTGNFFVSSWLHPLLQKYDPATVVLIERVSWWLHIAGILLFLNYLSRSKHLHIILAFPNAYFARLTSVGKMSNMPDVQREVMYAFQPELATGESSPAPLKFGAADITDLSWKNLLDAYSCTECGRCSAACPASQTGKKLSPRRIMMATRDRCEEVGALLQEGEKIDEGKTLLHDYITEEELRACTTCNACVEECPVSISPLDIILQMRRYLIMEKSAAPQEWTMMFGNVENNFAPWKFSPEQRADWTKTI